MQKAHAAVSFGTGLRRQPLPIYKAFARVGIHREVANLERRQVLKEVAALRRGHPKIAEAGLDNHPRSGNLVPGNGNAEPRFVRSPAPDADQRIRLALRTQLGVEVGDTLGHFKTLGALEAVEIDHNDVVQILNAPVSQNHCALANELRGIHVAHLQLFAFARHYQRTHLQKTKLRILAAAFRQLDSELDFYGTPHGILADGHELFEDLRQRKQSVLQNRRKADDARARAA